MDRIRKVILFLILILCKIPFASEKLCIANQKLPSMGSFIEFQISINCQKKLDLNLFLEIQKKLDQIESELSLYQASSALQKLNKTGQISQVSPDFLSTLKTALNISHKTNGAFDVSIWPLILLVKNSFELKNKPPNKTKIQKLRDVINYKKIKIQDTTIQLETPGMQLTLDGIAKGYAVDWAAKKMQDLGFNDFLINFSGNMKWKGSPEKNKFWKVALWDYKNKKMANVIERTQGAIASSGAEHMSYSSDQVWNHILDPRKLSPPNLWLTTTVIGPEAEVCDALSTATFVMNEEEIKKVFKIEFPEYQVWVQKMNGEFNCLVGCS